MTEEVREVTVHTAIPTLRGPAHVLNRDAAKMWWLPLVTGNIWLAIAGTVLRVHPTSFTAVGVLVGVALGVAAVTEAALARAMTGGWRAVQYALAVLFGAGAVLALIRPRDTLTGLTSIMGLLLLVQGAFYVVRAVALRKQTPYWSIGLAGGGVVIQLALWISNANRGWGLGGRATFVLLWLGLAAVFRGISDMTLSLGLRRLGTATPDPAGHSTRAGSPPPRPPHADPDNPTNPPAQHRSHP
jgi:uncharacterized membrane protein HdeD (DUF308 family)